MKIAEWIQRHPAEVMTVSADASREQILAVLLSKPGLRDIYVLADDGQVIGHLSHKKLARLVLAEHRPVHTRRQIIERIACGSAREIMSTHFATAQPEEELDNVLHRQLEHDVEDMPVIDSEGKLLGVINLTEVLSEAHKQTAGS